MDCTTNRKPFVSIWTDGSCRGNPGVGGWGALLRFGEKEMEICGGEVGTTNNRMELMAAISALEALKKPCEVELTTDSKYVCEGMSEWIHGWRKKKWLVPDSSKLKNSDLWLRLDAVSRLHEVTWLWVKGHSGHIENERADKLADNGVNLVNG